MTASLPTLAIIGGTGTLGHGLALRWARAGYALIIGSRAAEKARATAHELAAQTGAGTISGMDNASAAAAGDIVVVTVPFAAHAAILEEIKAGAGGKVVLDATAPLVPPKVGTVRMPAQGSAALAAQQALGAEASVVSALQNVAAHKLAKSGAIDCDVLVCGDSLAARAAVIELMRALGLRALHAGPLANSVAAEALTSVLIAINRRYGVDGAGIRITGELADGA